MPAFATPYESLAYGAPGIDDVEMPAPAMPAAEAPVIVAFVLFLRFLLHARFLR